MSKSKPSPVDIVKPSKPRSEAEVAAILAAHEASEAAAMAEAGLAALAREYASLKAEARRIDAAIEHCRKAMLIRVTEEPAEHPAAEYRVIIGRMPSQRRFNAADFAADNPDHVEWLAQWFDECPGALTVRVLDRK